MIACTSTQEGPFENARSLRPVKKEHVWVSIAGHAEIGPRTHLPRVTECFSIDIAQARVLHPTGDRVEAGSEGDDIEFVQHTVGGEDAFRPDFDNRVSFGVNHIDVVFAELLIEILFEGGTFRTEACSGSRGASGGPDDVVGECVEEDLAEVGRRDGVEEVGKECACRGGYCCCVG